MANILPSGDISAAHWSLGGGASAFWSAVDDDPSAADGEYMASDATTGDLTVLLALPAQTQPITAATLRIRGDTNEAGSNNYLASISVEDLADSGVYLIALGINQILVPGNVYDIALSLNGAAHTFLQPQLRLAMSNGVSYTSKIEAVRLVNVTYGSGGVGSGPGGQLGQNASILVPTMVSP